MKRRLFLKTGSVGIGGIIALPTVMYGCSTLHPMPQGPSMALSLFQDGARLFDSSIAELRLSGSGELASAEAEDVTLAGTAEVDLLGVAQQVTNQQAAIPAELDSQFAESSSELLSAAGTLVESAPSVFPLDSKLQAELAEDFALLKVVKASTLLAGAAMATPQPKLKVVAAEKMIASAEIVHSAVSTGAESELIEGTEHLLAYSEVYVGSAEKYSAEDGYITGVETFESAVAQLAEAELVDGVANLMTSTDNIALSSEYYVNGVDNLNAGGKTIGTPPITAAEELIPYAAELVEIAPLFVANAQGESALLGAEKMAEGSSTMLTSSESGYINLGLGGQVLDIGADQFIGGEITYNGAEEYSAESAKFLQAAENFENGGSAEAEAEFIHVTAELLQPAAETFYSGAEALQEINLTDGVESLVPAAEQILVGAEQLQSEAENAEAKFGAKNMVDGAAEALLGASESSENPSKSLESGAESIEIGTINLMNGAAEFIQGYN